MIVIFSPWDRHGARSVIGLIMRVIAYEVPRGAAIAAADEADESRRGVNLAWHIKTEN